MEYNFEEYRNKSNIFGSKQIQLLLLFFSMVVIFGMHTSMSVAIVGMMEIESNITELYSNANKRSMILGSPFLGILISQLPSCYIANAFSPNKLICLGFMLSGFLHLSTPFIIKINWMALVFTRLIEGLLQGCITPCIHALLVRWMFPSERIQLGSLILGGSNVGIVIAMLISGTIAASALGWQSIFHVFGIASIFWAIIFYFTCLQTSSVFVNAAIRSEMKMQKVPWLEILSSLPVWSLIIVTCGQNWSFYMLLTELPTCMKYILEFNIQQSGQFSAIPYSFMWIISLLIWCLSEFACRNKVSIEIIRKTNSTLAMCCPAVAMVILSFVDMKNKTVAIPMFVLILALNGGVVCAHQVNHMELSQYFSGHIVALANTIGNFFSALAPIICGFIVTEPTNVEQWKTVFYVTASVNFLTNLVFVLFGKVETQYWSDLYFSSSRYRDQACRISTITAAYRTTLKDLNAHIKTEFDIVEQNSS